ncbi:hypothetical protein ACLOJK_017947 [Asimina triloba]
MSNRASGGGELKEEELEPSPSGLHERKRSHSKLRKYDSWDVEAAASDTPSHRSQNKDWTTILILAFQSIGVVYGDIGTSPLYVYSSTFTSGIQHHDDILGVLSMIFYTLTLLPLIKYVFIVLHANDQGDGGTFALYSLICRYAKINLIPSQQAEDRELSHYPLNLPSRRQMRALRVKSALEKSQFAKYALLLLTMLGTSMVIVLSAVGGITEATDAMTEGLYSLPPFSIRVIIYNFKEDHLRFNVVSNKFLTRMVLLRPFRHISQAFTQKHQQKPVIKSQKDCVVQRFGTDKVGYSFAPIILLWFLMIGGIGIFNFSKYDPSVAKALNPKYIIDYFRRNKKDAWISLGGAVLCITGTEAMFADLGHFSVRSIQISMCSVTFPCLILAYAGQASYLRENMNDVSQTFYKSIPGPLYWPMFVVAVGASIIASQAMISGTFSIIQQSLALGCFPLVKIVHTSSKYEGQVYVPEINYLLMIACVAVTAGFKTTVKIGNAYGIAVVFVMTLTSAFLVLIMVMIWKTHVLLIIAYVLVIGSVELLYLSSVLYKFDQGGYLPLAFAALLVFIMYIWNYVYRKKYTYELENKVSTNKVRDIVSDPSFRRLPGIAFFYSGLVQGIPPIFEHYISNVPALHSVLVFVSIKALPISKVVPEERFLFRRVAAPGEHAVFRCVMRYGYKDAQNEHGESFERALDQPAQPTSSAPEDGGTSDAVESPNHGDVRQHEIANAEAGDEEENIERLVGLVESEMKEGVVHLLGENEVVTKKGSRIGKRILIDYAYNILRRNLSQRDEVFEIPHKRLLKVGMTYEL